MGYDVKEGENVEVELDSFIAQVSWYIPTLVLLYIPRLVYQFICHRLKKGQPIQQGRSFLLVSNFVYIILC